MAVVQISRIQVRRGRKGSGTGLPQLASGEMAWAIDTQELYIGNGSVAEGAPSVGNTKVITQNDLVNENAFLDLLTYAYKSGDPSIIGTSVRVLQDRLDDRVVSTNFGTLGNGVFDNSVSLQRAIDQLFLNNTIKASSPSADGVKSRVTLELPAGIFKFSSTLLVPSYTTITGAGAGKTILQYTGTGTAIQFINDTSTIGNPSTINSTLGINQPRNISISNLTIHSATADQVAMKFDCVRNSQFENLAIEGEWNGVYHGTSRGLEFNALSSLITCNDNIFRNISISGFSYAVYAKQDILNNVFDVGLITDVRYGFALGLSANGTTIGEQYGPRDTHIKNYKFTHVRRNAVYLDLGSDTVVSNCVLSDVGNNGNGNLYAEYPQIYFDTYGNYTHNIRSDRYDDLSLPDTSTVYVPVVAGKNKFDLPMTKHSIIGFSANYVQAYRLPVNTDPFGVARGTMSYEIEYTYTSSFASFVRRGVLSVSADIDNGELQLTDDFEYFGDVWDEDFVKLDFAAEFLDELNVPYTGAPGQVPSTLCINYKNTLASDVGTIVYSYTSIF